METVEAIVIGAGPAGLAAASELQRRGIQVVIVDRADVVGASWLGHYDRLHLHTVRWLSDLPGLRIPRRFGRWVARDDVVAYLRAYARHHRLDIRLATEVSRVDHGHAGYTVRTNKGDIACPVVVVATGYNRLPWVPDWPGCTGFNGEVIHSAAYRNPTPFVGRDVLVVGAGNSGAEIACDLVEGGARSVRIAIRTPPNIVYRSVFGLPNQVAGVLLRHLPPRVLDTAARIQARLLIGDLRRHGLDRPDKGVYTRVIQDGAIPLIDVGFLAALRAGRIEVVPAVDSFDGSDAVLAGGRRLRVDAVIAATGYRRGIESLVGHLGILDGRGLPRVHGATTAAATPGLHFIGYTNPISGNLRELGIDARRIARSVAATRGRNRSSSTGGCSTPDGAKSRPTPADDRNPALIR